MSSQNSIPTTMFSSNETSGWKFMSDGHGKELFEPMLFETILFSSLSVVQCALLHPRFQHSASARWLRLSLGPLTIGWWLCYPYRSAVQSRAERKVLTGFASAIMVFKSIDWTFATGPFYLRERKTIDGVPVWEKESPSKAKSQNFELGEFVLWNAMLLTSQRGLRWSWGPPGRGNTDSFAKSVFETIRLQLVMLLCIAFLLCSQDAANHRVNPTAVLLNLGFPSFPGINLLAECVLSATFMFMISSSIEMLGMLTLLPTYFLYPLAKNFGLPSRFTETVLNPVNYPRQFDSLFNLSSVSHFWGKSWHQRFRRPFLFCGGKPAMALARFLGASQKFQKMFGVMGAFALSGIFHEYPLYAIQRAPYYPHPRVLFKTFPGTFLYFFVQSFGIILEQFIIPRIPKSLGGGRLWTLTFLFLTAPLFTHDICRPGGLLDEYIHPSQWTWLHVIVPVPFASRILGPK